MRDWYAIKNEAEIVRIDIYGSIGKSWWDDDAVSAKDVLEAIREANGKPIELHVNSEGGSVFDGFAIHSLLRDSPSYVTAYIDGLAASAASYIVEAADRVIMSDVAWFMIHNASSFVFGSKNSMRQEADLLEQIDNTIAKVYASRSTEHDVDDFLAFMDGETWMDAETAQSYGLVDEVTTALPAVAHLALSTEESIKNAPDKAKAAIMAMAINPEPKQEQQDAEQAELLSDTSTIMNTVNDEGEQPAETPRAFHVIDGRIFHIEGKGGSNA